MIATRFAPFPALERLRRTPWSTLLGYVYFTLIVCLVARMALPADRWPHLHQLLRVLPLLPFIVKDLALLPDLFNRLKAAAARRSGLAGYLAAIPYPELVGLFRLDRSLRAGFWGWVRRKAPTLPPEGRPLTFLERGSYTTALAIIVVSSCTELPVLALVLPLLIMDAAAQHVVHAVLGLLSVYTLMLVAGDRWLVRARPHVLTGNELDLRVGSRTAVRIPLEDIAGCERLVESPALWRLRHSVDPRNSLAVTPLDRPNVVLRLKPGCSVDAIHYGLERNGLTCVFVYLDRPELLVAALAGRG